MESAIQITVTGPTGSGKSSIVSLIELVLKELSFPVDVDTPTHDRLPSNADMLRQIAQKVRTRGQVIALREVHDAPTISHEARLRPDGQQDDGAGNAESGPKTTSLEQLKAMLDTSRDARPMTVEDLPEVAVRSAESAPSQ